MCNILYTYNIYYTFCVLGLG